MNEKMLASDHYRPSNYCFKFSGFVTPHGYCFVLSVRLSIDNRSKDPTIKSASLLSLWKKLM